MVKKLLTIALGLTLVLGATAQRSNNDGHNLPSQRKTVTFAASDVQYWVGTGSNSAVVIIGWDDNPNGNFALAWGVHWNGSATAANMLDTIATYDERTNYPGINAGWMTGFYYDDGNLVSGSSASYWCYTINGGYADAYGTQAMVDGDVMEISSSCMFSLTTATAATDPNAVFSCLKAQAVSVTGLTSTTATVNITDTTYVNDYTVMLYAGDSLVDSTVTFVQTVSYTTLTANTGYTVKVYSNCLDGTQTASRDASFRTPCVAVGNAELPWIEDFQSGTGTSYASSSSFFSNYVFCWDLINPYSTSDPYINNSSSVNASGGKCLYVSSRPSTPTILVLPPFEDTPDQLRLQFDVLSTYRHGFEAGIITDVTDITTFTPIATCLPDGNGWTHHEVTFAGITSGRLALRSNDSGPAYLDNVTVDELPSCVKPSQVLASDITASSATLTIADPNGTNHYMIYADGDSVEVTTDTYTLNDLMPNTRYVVRVKTICSDTTTGTTEAAFRTSCGPIAIPYHEDFSQFVDVANGYGYAVADSTLPCWAFLKGRDLDRLELFTPSQSSTYAYGEDGYTMRIYGNYSNSRDIVVLPDLDQAINTLEISFMARPSETGNFGGSLQVGYITDAADSSTFVSMVNYPCAQFANGYDLCVSTFANAPSNARIALRYLPSGGSAKSWYIDDIDVHDMPACARAQGISVDSIGTDGFTLHVADPTTVNHYRYYLTANGVVDSADFYDTVTVVSNLTASTDYQLQVVSICEDGTLTLPHTIMVSTLCAPVTEIPFVENFESWTASQAEGMNRCWNRLYMNSSSRLVTNNYPYCASGTGNALNGFKSLKMYSKGTSSAIKEYSVAYLPEFEANMNTLKVSFFYKYGGNTSNINKVKVAVGVSETVADTTTFTRLATFTPSIVGWNEFEVELSAYTGTGNRITIMQTSTGTTAITSYIDSLIVDTVSSCNRPATLSVSGVSAYDATLTWTDPSEAGSYIVRWSDGTNTDSAIVTDVTSYELTDLTPSTNYTVEVSSICWGTPTAARSASFATSCAPMPLPWEMNFDNITNISQLSSCWNRYNGLYNDATSSATLTSTSSGWTRSTTAFDGSSHVKVNIYGTSCKYWLVTPEIDLSEAAELTFDYMLTAYNNTNVPESGAGLEDDRFVVLATTDGGTTWTPVAKWGSDTERDDFSFASLTNTVSHATVSLSAFTGQTVRLAFYGESTVDGPDNDFRIDNIMVAAAVDTTPEPPAPVEATIAASDILYWVGEGNDSAIFVISDGVSTRAWGYLFDEDDEPTALEMASEIAEYDPRLVYTVTDWTTFDMGFVYREYPTTISIADTRFKVNSMLADDGDMLSDIDVVDGMIIVVSSDTNDVWSTPIVPATVQHMPVNSTIEPSNILYWVGEGVNEAVVVVNWGVPDTALAWGLHFTGATTIGDAIDSIANADPRVTTDATHSTINYTDGNVNLSFQPAPASYMQFILGDNSNVNTNTMLGNGNQLKIGESAYGTGYDSVEYSGMWYPMGVVWNTTIHPVSVPVIDTTTPEPPTPQPEEATIASSDILFWVGEGQNEVVLAVNWADTALAWGYRFATDSVSTETMMTDIAAADPRFSVLGSGMISDINYIDTAAGMADTLGITTGNWWNSLLNGSSDSGMGQMLANGDFKKWADPAAGVVVDSVDYGEYGIFYTYVFPMTIHPVTVPDTTGTVPPTPQPEHGPFCGAVGTAGCNAIKADSSAIVAWATGITVVRGPQNIANPDGPVASTGTDSNALGMATLNNSLMVVSLGDGGSATLTFAHPIRNGEGPDFAVYENGFGDSFLELAFVEVSSDGERFVRFPATSLTQTETQTNGYGTTDPTFINNLAGKYRIGYGTPFDLAELADSTGIDIDSIVYVRIVDVVGSIDPQYGTYDAFGHIINDPWPTDNVSGGFDLSGVGVLHERIDSIPVPPAPVEATIAASDIIYWVGEGANEAILAVNWADTALAWGYRFDGTKTVADMMEDIAAADPRFSYTADGMLDDIIFVVAEGDTLRKQNPSVFWESKNNGITDAGMAQTLSDGDFEKWAEPAAGVVVDSIYYEGWGWIYISVYDMEIHPVSVPEGVGIYDVTTVVEGIIPNPTTDYVNVVVNRAVEAVLYDLSGRRVAVYSLSEGSNKLDLTALQNGVYMLRTYDSVSKIIKR